MPKKNGKEKASSYQFCSKVKIIILDGGNQTEVEAYRYLSNDDDRDLIVWANPKRPKWRRGLKLRLSDKKVIKPAGCDLIDQPLTDDLVPGDRVPSRVCDKSNPNGWRDYTCMHGEGGLSAFHQIPDDIEACREMLGVSLCNCGGSHSKTPADGKTVLEVPASKDK